MVWRTSDNGILPRRTRHNFDADVDSGNKLTHVIRRIPLDASVLASLTSIPSINTSKVKAVL